MNYLGPNTLNGMTFKLGTEMETVIFEYNEDGIVAKLKTNHEIWGHGASEHAAIGRMICDHPMYFGLNPVESNQGE